MGPPARQTDLADPIIVLAPARSFTSVVAAMIGRHPQLYGLPETHPFVEDTLAARWQAGLEAEFPMNQGLVRAVAELCFGGQTETTVRQARGWLRRGRRGQLTMAALLKTLAERVHPRILVDKSPTTVQAIESMRRAYAQFPQARFIHLLRHPRTQGESVMKLLARRTERGAITEVHWLMRMTSQAPPPPAAGEEPEPAPPSGTP